jgi:hypothetical protein
VRRLRKSRPLSTHRRLPRVQLSSGASTASQFKRAKYASKSALQKQLIALPAEFASGQSRGLQPSASSFSFARLSSTRGPITASMVVKAVVTLVKYDMPPLAAQRSSVPLSCGLRWISSVLLSS